MATINGDDGHNILTGTPEDDLIRGFGGNDELSGLGGSDRLEGGDDGDILSGGAGADELHGEGGDDSLTGGEGFDLLDGGDGLGDVVRYDGEGGPGAVVVNMSGTFYFDSGTNRQYQPGEALDTFGYFDILTGIEDVITGDGADVIVGSFAANFIAAGARNDFVLGEGGNDNIDGGSGDDVLYGGGGSDDLDGGQGDDVLIPGAQATGFDIVRGREGRDLLVLEFQNLTSPLQGSFQLIGTSYSGQIGNSNGTRVVTYSGIERFDITGTNFNDQIGGGLDEDWLRGFGGDDQLFGAGGADILEGQAGADQLYGGLGNDTLRGDVGNDHLFGEEDDDNLDGGTGDDNLDGGAGNDRLAPGAQASGHDQANGGAGTDLLVVDFSGLTSAITGSYAIDPAGGYSGQIGDVSGQRTITYSSIERYSITGTAQGDAIGGIDGDDELFGLGGNDLLIGGGGNDRLVPGSQATGVDEVRGGAGTDLLVVDFSSLSSPITGSYSVDPEGGYSGQIGDVSGQRIINYSSIERYSITGTAQADAIAGIDGDDELFGLGGNDLLIGGGGNDRLSPGAQSTGSDEVRGGAGTDTLVLDFSDLFDPLTGFYITDPDGGFSGQIGGGQRNVTYSSIERFEIIGTVLADRIGGADADDLLIGGRGADQLFGGAGNDTLSGGADSDHLHGGLGLDTLSGGQGFDTFHFASAGESAVGSADRILDFTQGQDRIDLSAVDANPSTPGDDPFVLSSDGEFHGVAGELRWYHQGGIFFIEGDLNGDRQADFQIELVMPQGAFPMTGADFVL